VADEPNGASSRTAKVAVVQPSAVFFDLNRGLDEACAWIKKAGEAGAELVVLPEAYVGGYPWGLSFGTAVGGRTEAGRDTWALYQRNALPVPGPGCDRLGEAAQEAGVYVAIGVIERDSTYSGGTLFCTILYFGPDGRLLGKHRKLKPTAAERLVWGAGDGSTMPVFNTPLGRLGGLICWENYMPLARMAMYGKGVQIYVAPTADDRDRWQSTIRHIAIEGRCFVLGCNQFVRRDHYPDTLPVPGELEGRPDILSHGGSAIYGPDGALLAGPLWDEEGLLTAEIDLGEIERQQFDFDVTGHYARPDVFRFEVNERPQPPVHYIQGD